MKSWCPVKKKRHFKKLMSATNQKAYVVTSVAQKNWSFLGLKNVPSRNLEYACSCYSEKSTRSSIGFVAGHVHERRCAHEISSCLALQICDWWGFTFYQGTSPLNKHLGWNFSLFPTTKQVNGFNSLLLFIAANQLRLVVYPIIYRVLCIPGGAGFLPSTVGKLQNFQEGQ